MAKKIVSKRFSLNKEEGMKVLKVFGWTVASAAVALLISLTEMIEVAPEYAIAVSLINTVLYAVKEFIKGQ